MSQKKSPIEWRHPKWREMTGGGNALSVIAARIVGQAGKWEQYRDAYYLDDDTYVERYLEKHSVETDDDFAVRKRLTRRVSLSRAAIDTYFGNLGKEPPAIDCGGDKVLEAFEADVDRCGTDMHRWMLSAYLEAAIHGVVYAIVDRPGSGELSEADNRSTAYRPYAYTVRPDDVPYLRMGADGGVEWALVIERSIDDADPVSGTGDTVVMYRLWTRSMVVLYDSEGVVKSERQNALGVVPIVPIIYGHSRDPWAATSMVAAFARSDRVMTNALSDLATNIRNACYPQRTMTINDAEMAAVYRGTDDGVRQAAIELGLTNVVLLGKDGKFEYVTYPASEPEAVARIYDAQNSAQLAWYGLEGEIGTQLGTESGTAKSYRFNKLNRRLATDADNMERYVRSLFSMVKLMTGSKSTATVSYPDEFDVVTLIDALDETERLLLLADTREIKERLVTDLYRKKYPDLPDDHPLFKSIQSWAASDETTIME